MTMMTLTASSKNTMASEKIKMCAVAVAVVVLCTLNVISTSQTLGGFLVWRRNATSLPMVASVEDDERQQVKDDVPASRSAFPRYNGQNNRFYNQQALQNRNKNQFVLASSVLDRTDPIFQRSGWDSDPIVIESHKLLFFTVPKNSCTEWKRLFRRMMNYTDWSTTDPHNPDSNGLRYLGHYHPAKQEEFMTSPNWTRAVFVRDPMQRLLSAFLDKALGPQQYVRQKCCWNAQQKQRNAGNDLYQQQCQVLSSLKDLPTSQDFTFATFVQAFMRQCYDPHWAPQARRLKPLNWKYINFVGHFDTLQQDARQLLERIGAWDDYGAAGWGPNGTLGLFERNVAMHSTSASRHQEEFFTPEVMDTAYQYLKLDYDLKLFNFTRPNISAAY
jgi:Sulfotransferase family